MIRCDRTISRLVNQKLNDVSEFLKMKASKNFTTGSYPFYILLLETHGEQNSFYY